MLCMPIMLCMPSTTKEILTCRSSLTKGARPMHYNPAGADFDPADTELHCPLPPLPVARLAPGVPTFSKHSLRALGVDQLWQSAVASEMSSRRSRRGSSNMSSRSTSRNRSRSILVPTAPAEQ